MTVAMQRFPEISAFNDRFLRVENCTAKFNNESVTLIENQCPTKLDFIEFIDLNQHAIEFKMINFKGKNSARFELTCVLCKFSDQFHFILNYSLSNLQKLRHPAT